MKYSNLEWTIGELINLIESQKINLRPPYQRNFIWSSKDQKLLIDSIRKGYPLPNFFILKNKDNTFEMVDGQQRAITIYKFIKNEFRDSSKRYYKDYNENTFMNYRINVVLLEEFNGNDIPFGNRIDLCLQIANGLKELKDIGYYHRDIKPDNILMFDDTWKIGDLGLIAFRDKDNIYDKKNDFIGPKGWLSPEAMNKYLQSDNNKYKFDCNIDHQSDVFQLGKVFWYILQGNAPIGNIRRSDFFDGHDDIYSVLKYMLNHSKKKRPISIDYVINELSRIMQKYKFVC